ncbi:hypothetical protein PILCRDRAFT_389834 [Piloderma croceum F 1598]|uniref:Uncharacterized protein n=1 Tax=Piloderma croceum (strain F 1598) TaxID=765440 RepID=A0A0C3G222_PILCF|nr:hypothetical protein PILCRDRAFT_389834 [Piloderma croceum F 1598]
MVVAPKNRSRSDSRYKCDYWSHDSTRRQKPFGLRFRVSGGGGSSGSGGGVGDRPRSRLMTWRR